MSRSETPTALVTVMRSKFARGWPRHPTGELCPVRPLPAALSRSYTTDAHFAAYATPNQRRLTREALDQGLAVAINVYVFDVDCPDTHGTSEPAPASWRSDLRRHVRALHRAHPHPYYYETRGGARLLYLTGEPRWIREQDDARRWTQDYAIVLAYLSRRFGIEADPACGDWQRLYRLPRATRDGAPRPESYTAIGHPERVGVLRIQAERDDVARAQERCKAFQQPKIQDYTPCAASGDGLFFTALRARGDVIREHRSGAYVIRCPRERLHSGGRTGDTSTLLYLPARGEELGAIHCMHAHCSDLSVKEWLREFSDSELSAARRMAGIPERRRSA